MYIQLAAVPAHDNLIHKPHKWSKHHFKCCYPGCPYYRSVSVLQNQDSSRHLRVLGQHPYLLSGNRVCFLIETQKPLNQIILTCSGWVDDQEGQPAILAARLALSLRRWVRLLQVGMFTE